MPTNLKSLLSRSRSRNELKSREKGEDSSTETGNNEGNGRGTLTEVGSGNIGTNGGTSSDFKNGHCECCSADEIGFRGGCNRSVSNERARKSDASYTNLFLSCSTLNQASSRTALNSDNLSTKNENGGCGSACATTSCSSSSPVQEPIRQNLSMRKCETVLALSSFTGNQSTSSTSPFNPVTSSSPSGASDKVKVMKDKIFSTSSSTLNCLLHSSSRSKLFSSWKLSSNSQNNTSSSHSPAYPSLFTENVPGPLRSTNESGGTTAGTKDFHQISRSQLSIPDSNPGIAPLTPLNRLRRNISINNTYLSLGGHSSCSRSSSVASFGWKEELHQEILCRLCLCNVKTEDTVEIMACACRYCKECITAYVNFEIQEGAEDIACPDATCEKQGVMTLPEIESLIPPVLVEKHKKFRLYREVERDGHLMWCPSPGCETVCTIQESPAIPVVDGKISKSRASTNNKSLIINCATCRKSFCADCKLSWHPGTSCEAFRRKLIKQGKISLDDEELFSLESIKKCPFCHVPIEKDSGCAQMMCKRCKHVFCWYCLASLDDDFLLRHYDKGPCKNKLGHSRASVVWHRAQVIGIFAGFGVLVLLASPLLILAAPCLLCCRCRYCANKLDSEEPPVPV